MSTPRNPIDDQQLGLAVRRIVDRIALPVGFEARVLSSLKQRSRPRTRFIVVATVGAAIVAVLALGGVVVQRTVSPKLTPAGSQAASSEVTTPPGASRESPGSSETSPFAGTGPSSTTTAASGTAQTMTPSTATVPTTAASSTTTNTSVPHAPPGTLVLTTSSNGSSYQIASGQVVWVVLPGDGQEYQGFTVPQSSDQAVLDPNGKPCNAPSGDFCTEFAGAAAGNAALTSTSTPACVQANPPCGAATEEWRVTIIVS